MTDQEHDYQEEFKIMLHPKAGICARSKCECPLEKPYSYWNIGTTHSGTRKVCLCLSCAEEALARFPKTKN